MHTAYVCGNWGRTKRNAVQAIDCRRSSGRRSVRLSQMCVHLLSGHGNFLASPTPPPKCSVCSITHSTSEHRNDIWVVVYVIKLRIKHGLLSVWRNALVHPSHGRLTKSSDVLIKMYLRMGFVKLPFTHFFCLSDFHHPINMQVQMPLSKLYCRSSPDVFLSLKAGDHHVILLV
jgi:hypothetical protein